MKEKKISEVLPKILAIQTIRSRFRLVSATALRHLIAQVKYTKIRDKLNEVKRKDELEVKFILNFFDWNFIDESPKDGEDNQDLHQTEQEESKEVLIKMENVDFFEEIGHCELFEDFPPTTENGDSEANWKPRLCQYRSFVVRESQKSCFEIECQVLWENDRCGGEEYH